MSLVIRNENASEADEMGHLITAAFDGKPYAGGNEAELVVSLRECGALSLSYVAILEDELVGQIAFSPAQAEDGTPDWYALAPVAVLPAHQGQGIGSRLIKEGLATLRERGAGGCILTGNPVFYERFGFSLCPDNSPGEEHTPFFQVKVLSGSRPKGPIRFHEAFDE